MDIGNKFLTKFPIGMKRSFDEFYCNCNNLSDWEGGPKSVDFTFDCSFNEFETLVGAPKNQMKKFNCNYNKLKSLEGGPKFVDYFSCRNNQLTNFVGGPESVTANFSANNNPTTSIRGIPKFIGGIFQLSNDDTISDLWQLPYLSHIGKISMPDNPMVEDLLKKYKNGGKQAALELQQKLIEIGYYD